MKHFLAVFGAGILLLGAGCQFVVPGATTTVPKPVPQPSVNAEVDRIRALEKEIIALADADPDIKASQELLPPDWPGVKVSYGDVTGDGQEEGLVFIISGGTAGTVGVLVYGLEESGAGLAKARLLQKILGYKMEVAAKEGRLFIAQPRYLKDDPNCCPSFMTYGWYNWDGRAFKAVSSTEEFIGEAGRE